MEFCRDETFYSEIRKIIQYNLEILQPGIHLVYRNIFKNLQLRIWCHSLTHPLTSLADVLWHFIKEHHHVEAFFKIMTLYCYFIWKGGTIAQLVVFYKLKSRYFVSDIGEMWKNAIIWYVRTMSIIALISLISSDIIDILRTELPLLIVSTG